MKKIALFLLLFASAVTYAQDVSLKMKQVGGKLFTVKVTIAGKERSLIIDSGAQMTSLSPEAAGISRDEFKRQKKQVSEVRSMGVTGGSTAVFAKANMSFGELLIKDHDVTVEDFNGISDGVGDRVDGILGQDILASFKTVTFDFKSKTLTLSR